jgi:hypothetical protein
MTRQTILNDISYERDYQEGKWGDEFDKKNTPNDWLTYIGAYTGKAFTFPFDPDVFRASLVKVAALCVAAIEQLDKNDGAMPKRHYD